jgi:predicted DNA-binding protein with PD1-like motif
LFKHIHTFRVKPGRELITDISHYCNSHGISSGLIICIIGSVKKARLNFLMSLPGKYDSMEYTGPLEIVCAQGSVALKNNETIMHIHILLSGKDICRGGHLAEAEVFSTAEVSIGELNYQLQRRPDNYTGLNELLD